MHDSHDSTLGSSFSFDVSVSRSVQRYASEVATRVPFPVIFIAGAALGILLATIFVTLGHHTTPTFSSAAPPAATVWAPLPVVTIHPAPPEPVAAPLAAAPRVVAQRAVVRTSRKGAR